MSTLAGEVGGVGIERIKGTDKEGLLDVGRLDRCGREESAPQSERRGSA